MGLGHNEPDPSKRSRRRRRHSQTNERTNGRRNGNFSSLALVRERERGRLWATGQLRSPAQPSLCLSGRLIGIEMQPFLRLSSSSISPVLACQNCPPLRHNTDRNTGHLYCCRHHHRYHLCSVPSVPIWHLAMSLMCVRQAAGKERARASERRSQSREGGERERERKREFLDE